MIAVLQRVRQASVSVDGEITGSCGQGYAILLGVRVGDCQQDAELLCEKIAKLRVFSDENGKMNRSVVDVGGSAVVVSQFTLMADYHHGNRPSFLDAAPPAVSKPLYEFFVECLSQKIGKPVGCGVFGAHMLYEISNDGPVTIIMDSAVLQKRKTEP